MNLIAYEAESAFWVSMALSGIKATRLGFKCHLNAFIEWGSLKTGGGFKPEEVPCLTGDSTLETLRGSLGNK